MTRQPKKERIITQFNKIGCLIATYSKGKFDRKMPKHVPNLPQNYTTQQKTDPAKLKLTGAICSKFKLWIIVIMTWNRVRIYQPLHHREVVF